LIQLLTDDIIWSVIFEFREPEVTERFLEKVFHRDGTCRDLLLLLVLKG
jgi:hypothetical protein